VPLKRLLLVDDHPVFRHGVKRLLTEALPEVEIAEAVDGSSAMEWMRPRGCDLVLLDVTLPGPDGLAVIKELRAEFPHVPVLIVSMHPADQFARRMIAAGAIGYVTKDTDPAELVRAVTLALKGQRYLAVDAGAGEPPPRHQRLSDREYQVLRMIASGRTVSQIADELFLSVNTVSTYRARILEKMEMENNAELMRYALALRLVP
jgi:two-component system, NarL family, invasion response regulator UvrY